MRLVSDRTGAPYLAWLIPIAPAKSGPPSHRQSLVETFDYELMILLLVSPARRSAEIPAEAIQAAFSLSAAEARLASALLAGRSLGAYAAGTGVARNTVRNQLAAVFDRMRARRGTELVAIIVHALGPVGARTSGRRWLREKA
jgi:DNA-binding CsgD family transcriptional regulator